VIEQLLPPFAAVSTAREDLVADLFPEEQRQVSDAAPKRRREFATARACARAALAELGIAPAAVPSGPKGEPKWPAGVVGSITHCRGYRACAVARSSELAALGIDAEPNEALPEGLLPDIALPPEREAIGRLMAEDPGTSWDRLLFCIKESVYKAWFPLTGRWLGFEDAQVSIDRFDSSFVARLLVPGPAVEGRIVDAFSGRWLQRGGLLLTAIAMPVRDRPGGVADLT